MISSLGGGQASSLPPRGGGLGRGGCVTNSDVLMILGGDLHVQRPEPESIFASIGPVLQEADILFGNLEMPPTTVDTALVEQGLVAPSHSEDRMIAAYTHVGFDAVSLANNHAIDHGPAAFAHCLDLLDEAGIQYSGGGRHRAEAHRPAI